MTKDHKAEFATTIGALCEAFNQECTRGKLLAFWMGLRDLEIGEVQEGVYRAIRECESFLPTPATIRKLAGVEAPEEAAIRAWMDVLRAVPLGPYKHIDFRDKAINAALRACGGWVAICDRMSLGGDEEKWVKREFVQTYRVLACRKLGDEQCAPLCGLATSQIRNGKLEDPRPVITGTGPERMRIQ